MNQYIKLGLGFRLVGGGTPATSKEEYWCDGENGSPWISSADIDLRGNIRPRRTVSETGIRESATNIVPAGTVIVVTRVGLGKVAILPSDMCFSQDIQALLPKTVCEYNSKFLLYQISYKMQRLKYWGQGTTISGITKKQLGDVDLFFPPLPEQERIVTRIEEQFSQLDNGVETLKRTKQQLAVYRQAVLNEAFSGCSEVKTVEQVCSVVTDGDHFPPPKSESGIPFIMISNISNNKIIWQDTHYVSQEYYNSIGEKRTPVKGDVLYTVTGSYGIPLLVDFEKAFCFQRHIALLRPSELILQKYLYYAMQSPYVYQQATAKATGTAQKTVALSVLRKIIIPYCNVNEQAQIVCELEDRLSTCTNIEQALDTALQQAEALRQSILKKAFEGE